MSTFNKGDLVLATPWANAKKGYGVVISDEGWQYSEEGISREGKTMGDEQHRCNWTAACFDLIAPEMNVSKGLRPKG